MTPFYIMQLTAAPLSQTLNLIERQGVQLVWDALRLIVGPGAMVAVAWSGKGLLPALAAYSAGMVVAYIALMTLCDVYINDTHRQP